MKRAVWYFDFVSPFAYLHSRQLADLEGRVEIEPRPVLLVAMLNHWGQKGPAEIPGKRTYSYRYLVWLAHRRGIPFRMPATHPFNPLPYLRLALACGCERRAIDAIFARLYTSGEDPADPGFFARLAHELGREDAEAAIAAPEIKEILRRNGDLALESGVFGVPTLAIDGELYWGEESLAMVRDYLTGHAAFTDPEMQRATTIAPSARRQA